MTQADIEVGIPSATQTQSFQLGWKGCGMVMLFGVSMLLAYHLCNPRVLSLHEVLFAQAARDMLQTGDWLVPRIGGVVFGEKPLFTSWSIMAAISLCGSDSEWVVRLPSSLAALLTALIIALTAARWFGRRVGILAGLIQLTTYYLLQMATLAESDMLLIFSITAALCFFAWARIESPLGKLQGRWTPWMFLSLVGLCFMIKGPVGVIFIGLSCSSYMLSRREWSLLRFFFHPGGLLLFALLALPYPLLAGWRYPPLLDEWLMHNWGRFRGELSEMQVTQPMLFYFYTLPVVLLPWLPFALPAFFDRTLWKQPIIWFSLCWLIPGLLFLSASAWKWKHYLSPLLPGLTFIMAVGLDQWIYRISLTVERAWRPMMTTALALGVIGLIGVLMMQPLGTKPIAILILIVTLGSMVLFELTKRKKLAWAVPMLFALVWCSVVVIFGFVLPEHDNYLIQTQFAQRINHRDDIDTPLHLVNVGYDQIIYYLKAPVIRKDTFDDFQACFPVIQSPVWLLIRKSDLMFLKSKCTIHELDSCSSPRKNEGDAQGLVLVHISPLLHLVDADSTDASWTILEENGLELPDPFDDIRL